MNKKDLEEFVKMLDFKKVGKDQIEIVSNRFTFAELPDSIQNYIIYYFKYLELIK